MHGFRPRLSPPPGPKKLPRPQPPKQSKARQHLQNILPRLAWPFRRRQWNPYLHSNLPNYRKWWWFLTKMPKLMITVAVLGVRYPVMRILYPQPRKEEEPPHSSALGLLLYNMLVEKDARLQRTWNEAIRPWGELSSYIGCSMQPTFTGDREFGYSSFSHIGGRNCRPGDVVSLFVESTPRMSICKRIRALEGEVFDQKSHHKMGGQFRPTVPPGYCYVLGDNFQRSSDSRWSGSLPLYTIVNKVMWIWGAHGFRWIDHTLQPWLEHEVKKPQRPTRIPPARAAPGQQLSRKQGEAKLPAVRGLFRTKVPISKHDLKNLKVVDSTKKGSERG